MKDEAGRLMVWHGSKTDAVVVRAPKGNLVISTDYIRSLYEEVARIRKKGRSAK